MAKFLVRVHMEKFGGEVERVPMTFHTEAEAEAFIKSALLADCVLAAERTWRTTQAEDGPTKVTPEVPK